MLAVCRPVGREGDKVLGFVPPALLWLCCALLPAVCLVWVRTLPREPPLCRSVNREERASLQWPRTALLRGLGAVPLSCSGCAAGGLGTVTSVQPSPQSVSEHVHHKKCCPPQLPPLPGPWQPPVCSLA